MVERDIEFVLLKNECQLWPRLLSEVSKPAWLKVDFDKMHADESEEETNVDDWRKTQNSARDVGSKNFGRGKKQTCKFT